MTLVSRRDALTFFAAGGASCALGQTAKPARPGLTIGAIRWDAWYIETDSGPRIDMERALGPSRWQSRAPACARILSPDRIDLGACGTQAQVDAEITAAAAAGLNYWAFVWYGATHDLQNAWRLYRASPLSRSIKWCLIFSSYSFFAREMGASTTQYVEYIGADDYQKVLSVRPVFYLLPDKTPASVLRPAISSLRAAARTSGTGNPYIVLLVGATTDAIEPAGADAIGIYSKANAAPSHGAYADLVKTDEAYWRTLAATGSPSIPTALTGADRRPRVEHPVPWEAAQKPFVGDDLYYVAGSPAEIAKHIGGMIAWLKANEAACPAQTGLVYSWNEHDEGGSTLNPTLGGDHAVLDAVARELRLPR